MTSARAYIDGSGNSSRIQACAVMLEFPNMDVYEKTKILPPHTTNNVGEYNGALLAVRFAKEFGVRSLRILSDSKLIVNQLLGLWDCRNPQLRTLRDRIWQEAQIFDQISIEWVPREENSQADSLCREAIKKALSGNYP